MALPDKFSMEAILAQAAAHAKDGQWAEAQIGLQVAQLVLLSKLANEPNVLEMLRKHWTNL